MPNTPDRWTSGNLRKLSEAGGDEIEGAGGDAVDHYARAFYEQVFLATFLQKRGEEFQNFFSSIMEKCHPGDFIRTRPWGPQGDRKNDGYLASQRMLFQSYGPSEVREAETIAKIDEDYFGAIPHWREHFDRWVFVHNSYIGLPPGVERKLLDLDTSHSDVRVRPWGFEELRQKLFSLSQTNLASLLGAVPSRGDVLNVQVPELQTVLLNIAAQPAPAEPDLRPVPLEKLTANGLTDGVRMLLALGMIASDRVKNFFARYHDPTLGDRVAQAFRREYESRQAEGLSADAVFAELQVFAGGQPPALPQRQAAVLAVLAYLFEACDIYERPREEEGP